MHDPLRIRRARPLLGTLVDITVLGTQHTVLGAALEAGFAAIARIESLMSFQRADSDVSRLNRDAARGPVEIAADTWRVLATAARCAEASGGTFDITVAPHLVARGRLPFPVGTVGAPAKSASWRDVELLDGNRVRFSKPLWLDLGGIAKGYAVDVAVAALRGAGVAAALVNAGGDMRGFGEVAWPVWLRNPVCGGAPLRLAGLVNGSIATSAAAGDGHLEGGPHVDPAHARRVFDVASATVFAQDCVVADALTKVVMIRGGASFDVLQSLGARALAISPDGQAWASDPGLIACPQALQELAA